MKGFRERCLAGVLLMSCALVSQGADRAAAKPVAKSPPPDLDFLEYLGTLESDEENWTDVVNMDLPTPTSSQAKSVTANASKSKSKPETAAKSAGNDK